MWLAVARGVFEMTSDNDPPGGFGRRLTFTNGQAYDLVMKVAAGELDQVEKI